jgi:hypothetical protein
MSISRFEKLIPEIERLGPEERKKLSSGFKNCFDHFKVYLGARDAVESQKQFFRGSVKAVSLASSLEKISKDLDGDGKPDPGEKNKDGNSSV